MQLVKKSFQLVNKNLLLVVPFVLQSIIEIAIILGITVASGIGFMSLFESGNISALGILFVVPFLIFLVVALIHSYVVSGVVGMLKEAMDEKEIGSKQFFEYAKKYVWKVFAIQTVGGILLAILILPFTIFTLKTIITQDSLSFSYFAIYFVFAALAVVIGFVMQFAMIPLIRDEKTMMESVKSAVKIIPKGIVDCLKLLLIVLLLGIPFILLGFLINLIPILGQILSMVIGYYFYAILIIWLMYFYEKHK